MMFEVGVGVEVRVEVGVRVGVRVHHLISITSKKLVNHPFFSAFSYLEDAKFH